MQSRIVVARSSARRTILRDGRVSQCHGYAEQQDIHRVEEHGSIGPPREEGEIPVALRPNHAWLLAEVSSAQFDPQLELAHLTATRLQDHPRRNRRICHHLRPFPGG